MSPLKSVPPAGLRYVNMREHRPPQRKYVLAFSEKHSAYEAVMENLRGPDANGELLATLLGGGGTLIDVGANIGTLAVPVSVAGSAVVAIEMIPANCLRLWAAAAANGLRDFHVVQAAASDHEGIVGFHGSEAWGAVGEGGTPALCLRLDSIVDCLGPLAEPVVIKVDVEGHEGAVLAGATETIQRFRPPILIENIEIEGEYLPVQQPKKMIDDLGYDLFMLRGNVLSPQKSGDLQEGHVVDFLAVPRERSAQLQVAGWEVRPLSDEERIAWAVEMARFDYPNHQRHSAGVLLRWQREQPALAARAAPQLLPILLALDSTKKLHARLKALQ